MTLIDILGIIGVIIFFIKVCIHANIKWTINKKFPLKHFGRYVNPVFFIPILDDVGNKQKMLKRIGNILYVVSVVLIGIYVVVFINGSFIFNTPESLPR